MLLVENWFAVIMLGGMTVYMLSGGADFGGGIWDLLAMGPRARDQRNLIAQAIGPIWEANHVWLILVVVLLFVAFPAAFAGITTALNIPLTLLLFGIVFRGSAFAFRTCDREAEAVHRRWSRLFAVSSVTTPFMLGVVVGAVASGTIRVDPGTGVAHTDFISSWLAPFPLSVGALAVTLCALLAAVYLTLETDERLLREDFRRRALAAAVGAGVMAWICCLLAADGAPVLWDGLVRRSWSIPFQIVTAGAAAGTIAALWQRRFRLARVLVIGQVALVLWGWGLSQYPCIVVPDPTFANTAAPASVLRPVLVALGAGSLVLVPAFAYLYHLFKRVQTPQSAD